MPVEHTPTHQMPTRSTLSPSLATDQRSLLDPRTRYPLWPPLLGGDPTHSDERVQYPVEVGYDLASLRDPTNRAGLLGDPVVSGLRRWAALLPPLVAAADLGAGDTPLLEVPRLAAFTGHDGPIYVKDETQNPTWSRKDPVEPRHPQHRVGVRRPRRGRRLQWQPRGVGRRSCGPGRPGPHRPHQRDRAAADAPVPHGIRCPRPGRPPAAALDPAQ